MDELTKLRRLLPHWREHNDEHAESYKRWSETATVIGRPELSGILMRLYEESKRLNRLFDEAVRNIEDRSD